ncbi:MAG: hypothetical protein WD077_08440 [Bacteroidia bacterium]
MKFTQTVIPEFRDSGISGISCALSPDEGYVAAFTAGDSRLRGNDNYFWNSGIYTVYSTNTLDFYKQ